MNYLSLSLRVPAPSDSRWFVRDDLHRTVLSCFEFRENLSLSEREFGQVFSLTANVALAAAERGIMTGLADLADGRTDDGGIGEGKRHFRATCD